MKPPISETAVSGERAAAEIETKQLRRARRRKSAVPAEGEQANTHDIVRVGKLQEKPPLHSKRKLTRFRRPVTAATASPQAGSMQTSEAEGSPPTSQKRQRPELSWVDLLKELYPPDKYPKKYPDSGKERKGPNQIRDYRLVEEVFQNEFGITTARDPKPISVTYGAVNCVGMAGYNEDQQIGFTAHYQVNTDIDTAFGMLLYNLSRLTKGEQRTFKVRLKGGLARDSEHIVERLRNRLTTPLRPDITFEIEDEDVLAHEVTGKDIGIDTQTGKFITSYYPLDNPHHREPYPSEAKDLIFASKTPMLHYFPEAEVEAE